MFSLPYRARLMTSQFHLRSHALKAGLISFICVLSAPSFAQILNAPGTVQNTTIGNPQKNSRSAIAAKADPSPFEDNPSAVQSAQMQPSLATPFIVLQRVPEPKNKNAIPEAIYKLISDKKFPEAMAAIDKELASNPRNVQLRFIRSRVAKIGRAHV